ncbi:MAG: NFACT family protein [Vampirovibrio sp.]|nr:NFACT family protein [Vampirovibrio sp.]
MPMQALDAITLNHLAAEYRQLLVGAKINKIQHVSGNEFILGFWGISGANWAEFGETVQNHRLYINLTPDHACCLFADPTLFANWMVPVFEKPTAFCMLLRKHLMNAKVLALDTLPGERVLNISVENFNELGNRVLLSLSIELMGKQTNMLLVDTVQNIILGAAHTVSAGMSRYREVGGGLPYAPPPRPLEKKLFDLTTEPEFLQMIEGMPLNTLPLELPALFWGISKVMAEDVVAISNHSGEVYAALKRLVNGTDLQPGLTAEKTRFSLLSPGDSAKWSQKPSVMTLVKDYYASVLSQTRFKRLQQQLESGLARRRKQFEKKQQDLESVDTTEIEAAQYKGDLILTAVSMGELPPSPTDSKITVTDMTTNQPVNITVDPTLTWSDNAQKYFQRARKKKARQSAFEDQTDHLTQEQGYLDELQRMVTQADSVADLAALREEFEGAGILKQSSPEGLKVTPGRGKSKTKNKSKPSKKDISGVMTLQSSDGFGLLVGKTGEGNAWVSGKLSAPEDLWLHVHLMPGAHVVIQTNKQDIPDQTLLEAANLAVYYSSARDSKNVPVIYTQCKHVRKIPGSYPGHVNYKQEQTVFITPDEVLIQRLIP